MSSYRPHFGYDIRIHREDAGAAPRAHPCAVPGCAEEGVCRCPVSPHDLSARLWLCTAHARAHNEQWDFFAGMSEAEIARFQEEAVIGHRPTWPLGRRTAADGGIGRPANGRYVFEDGYAVFAEARRREPPRRPVRILTTQQSQAFDTLGVENSASLNEIKARYKELVKRFHPDANGGDRGAEERLKQVIKAYGVLRAGGFA
jgi:DnaJ-domain-containing protein 1